MFICPECNITVDSPDSMPPPWWMRMNRFYVRPVPTCPSGHRLRTEILGNLTAAPLIVPLLRTGFASFLGLVAGMLEDLRGLRSLYPHFGLVLMTIVVSILGIIALGKAWSWAGMNGPVNRLTARAFGSALGYLLPSIIACHALYFRWADALEAALTRGILTLGQALTQAFWPDR
jgi:hypothetical protein